MASIVMMFLVAAFSIIQLESVLSQACDDRHNSCPSWARSGYCRTNDYVKKFCMRSCNLCPDSCSDMSSSCPGWARAGYCRTNDWVKKNCRESCGACTAATTAAPVMTTQPRTQPSMTTRKPTQGTCGVPSVVQSRVISGQTATPGAWPWQILMLYNRRTSCGGSLVAPQWVVTAAHCVSGKERYPRAFTIRAGEHYSGRKDGNEQEIAVSQIFTHHSYSSRTLNNDIALMRLEKPFVLNKRIGLVCLPDQDRPVPVGTQCYITGWGKINHPGSMHHTLQQAKMPVVSQQACSALNTRNLGLRITEQMVCAGHGGSTRVSGCHGDSGGPFVCQTGSNGAWVLHGAVSWGSGDCSARRAYTVFARVSYFRDWIDRVIGSY